MGASVLTTSISRINSSSSVLQQHSACRSANSSMQPACKAAALAGSPGSTIKAHQQQRHCPQDSGGPLLARSTSSIPLQQQQQHKQLQLRPRPRQLHEARGRRLWRTSSQAAAVMVTMMRVAASLWAAPRKLRCGPDTACNTMVVCCSSLAYDLIACWPHVSAAAAGSSAVQGLVCPLRTQLAQACRPCLLTESAAAAARRTPAAARAGSRHHHRIQFQSQGRSACRIWQHTAGIMHEQIRCSGST